MRLNAVAVAVVAVAVVVQLQPARHVCNVAQSRIRRRHCPHRSLHVRPNHRPMS